MVVGCDKIEKGDEREMAIDGPGITTYQYQSVTLTLGQIHKIIIIIKKKLLNIIVSMQSVFYYNVQQILL